MLYFINALLLLIGFIVIYKALMPIGEPDMELMNVSSNEELKAKMIDLAVGMKSTQGESLMSSYLIRKTIHKAYKNISRKVGVKKCLDFEDRIYDNFYKLSEIISKQKKLTTAYNKLPGYKKLPRIYRIAQLLVKASGGNVTIELIKENIAAFNEIAPLTFKEAEMLPSAIYLALLEYIAIFCARSEVINRKFDSAMADIAANNIDLKNINYNSYAYAFVAHANGELLRRFDALCTKNGLSAYKRADNFLDACARYASRVASAFSTIYSLAPLFGDELILELCPLHHFLASKEVVYDKCTTDTKFVYLRRIAKKAKDKNEIALAGEIVDKATAENKDIAHYILPRPLGKFALIVYMLIVVGNTLGNCVAIFMYIGEFKWAAAIVFLPISLSLVLMFVTSINARLFSRRYMPRIKLDEGRKAMIVFPVIVFDEKEVDETVNNLLTVSCANSEEIFSYGLLLDLPASSSPLLSEVDERIIERAKSRFSELDSRFNLFIRRRTKVNGEEKYQGYEKKRGAILDLNNFILNGDASAFEVAIAPSCKTEYVITLDSDTMLNCAYELVQIMEHPFNRDKAVVAINMRTDPSSVRTPFAQIMHDSIGLNSYSNFVADVNYDLFGSGNYTGKGIYRVREFTQKVGEVFMENRVLSHDFVEGTIAGCGLSGESAIDDYPQTFSAYLSRNIRWLRGDYQLFPYLFTRIRDKNGKLIRNPISIIGRLHILNNILLGLIPISSAILLILSFFASQPVWLTGLAFVLNIFMILGVFRMIFFRPKRVIVELLRQLLTVVCLPTVAYNYLKAITVTFYRLIVKKDLLDWKVFAHTKGKVSYLPNILTAVVYIVACILNFHVTFVVMAVLFAFGAIYAELLGRRKKEQRLSDREEAELKKIAADTWIYFEKQLKAENNYLPFDNFQEANGIGYAPRTSPTDISFMITSLVAARNFGFVTEEDFSEHAEHILLSVERAEKWKGNLYNWLDIYSLKRLSGYVSSVDSGNLLASLILLRNASSGTVQRRAQALIAATDIGAFFDEQRGLLRIGYNNDAKSFDANHYDMLGSESMLTYLVAIGLGKLKSSCFKNLAGRCVKYKGISLYSWTGGAFEYMMSSIYFEYCQGGLLQKSARSVLRGNIAYARKCDLPFWGSSESQYSAFDASGNYQYKAFGVPDIALSNERRKPVVSPYASMLFLKTAPRKVVKNIDKMNSVGLKGKDGLYEAYDGEAIKTYMAHHQGMILASVCNYFSNNALCKMMASPDMRAAALLITMPESVNASRKREYECLKRNDPIVKEAEYTSPPSINLHSNGRYSMLIDSLGGGYSYYKGRFVSRGYDGLKLYLGDEKIDIQRQKAYFHDGMTEFVYSDGKCEIKQLAAAASEINGEARRITVKNLTRTERTIVLYSYMSVALTDINADMAHKTFSGMFVVTDHDERLGAVTASRGSLILAHCFDMPAEYESNRANFFGRGTGEKFGRVLDPIVSGKVVLTLKPYEKQTVCLYNIVAEDRDLLRKQIELTKRENFFDTVIASAPTLSKRLGMSERMRAIMSKLCFDASPDFMGSCPLVYIESNVVTERIKAKLKLLSKLALFGMRCKVAFVYHGDGFTKERICEALGEVGCEVVFINKNDGSADVALRSATDIDEIVMEKLNDRAEQKALPSPEVLLPKIEYAYKLGFGGFLSDGTYAMELSKTRVPPRAWSNIIANENFGTIITESGGGYTFYKNSRENKLTEWSNDPILDKCGEGIIIFENGICWSCTRSPITLDTNYQAFHSFGVSEFRCGYNAFVSRVREFIFENTKYYELTLTSALDVEREVSVMFFVTSVLGDFYYKTARNLRCKSDDNRLRIVNSVSNEQFFVGCNKNITNYVCHKQSYVDKYGNYFLPKDDCGYEFAPAVVVKIAVPARSTQKVTFYLSADGKIKKSGAELLIRAAKNKYSSLSHLSVSTGNPALDYLAKWLPYQILCSRFFGRTGFYQAGGAIGFRDQLQDCLGVLHIDPQLVRAHILDCAAHQFEAGDVQHWWHPPRTGVRTTITDDRLFLPYVTAEYIEFTGDENILHERIPYLKDVKLLGKDYYGTPEVTASTGTLLEHCMKAIRVSSHLSENGLMYMGGGDWNDAMNSVGALGKGTTVWGTMFLYVVLNKFMTYIKDKKPIFALKEKLRRGIESAWDGEWFLRAVCDDGTVLGSKDSSECKIDLITQSFAALCDCVALPRKKLALLSAASKLVDTDNGLIKLLSPPLHDIKAGYISDYPPGVRENGGQYTHGAVWFIMSLFEMGEADYAYSLLNMINPINHSLSAAAVAKYEVEPYVISGDIYSEPAGKGGWSWYTGAATWYYHVMIKHLFGIMFRGDVIEVKPNLPLALPEVYFTVKKDDFTVYFKIDNTQKEGSWRMFVEGRGYNTNTIKLTSSLDGKEVIVRRYND